MAHVEVVGRFDATWTIEIERVCAAMPSTPDLDPTARVRITAGAPVTVAATLGDGRTAVREVASASALRHTIEALVVMPPPLPTAPAAAPPNPTTPPQAAAPAAPAPEAPSDPASLLSVELGVLFEGRVQGTPLYAGFGPTAWACLNYADWLFGLDVRFDAYQAQPTGSLAGFEMMSFGAGLEFARRFEIDPIVGLDAGVGVQVLEELQSAGSSDGQTTGESNAGETAGEATDVRLLVLSRVHVGGRGVRFTADVEAELSPLRVGRDTRVDPSLPTLPAFGLGLGAGISWQGP